MNHDPQKPDPPKAKASPKVPSPEVPGPEMPSLDAASSDSEQQPTSQSAGQTVDQASQIEARIVADILGEASDFERDELTRVIEEHPELSAFQEQMQSVHGLLRVLGQGELLESQDSVSSEERPREAGDTSSWKLSDARREKIIATLEGRIPSSKFEAGAGVRASSRRRLVTIVSVVATAAAACLVAVFLMQSRFAVLARVEETAAGVAKTGDLQFNAAPDTAGIEEFASEDAGFASGERYRKFALPQRPGAVADNDGRTAPRRALGIDFVEDSQVDVDSKVSLATPVESEAKQAVEKFKQPTNGRIPASFRYARPQSTQPESQPWEEESAQQGQSMQGVEKSRVKGLASSSSNGSMPELVLPADQEGITHYYTVTPPSQTRTFHEDETHLMGGMGGAMGSGMGGAMGSAGMGNEPAPPAAAGGGYWGGGGGGYGDRYEYNEDYAGKKLSESREKSEGSDGQAPTDGSRQGGAYAILSDMPSDQDGDGVIYRGNEGFTFEGRRARDTREYAAPAEQAESRKELEELRMLGQVKEKALSEDAFGERYDDNGRQSESAVELKSDLASVENQLFDAPDQPIAYPDAQMWSELSTKRRRFEAANGNRIELDDATKSYDVSGGGFVDSNSQASTPDQPIAYPDAQVGRYETKWGRPTANTDFGRQNWFGTNEALKRPDSSIANADSGFKADSGVAVQVLSDGERPTPEALSFQPDSAYRAIKSSAANLAIFHRSSGLGVAGQPILSKLPTPAGMNEKDARAEAFSTFSLHVSDVSFKLARAALAKGEWPTRDKIRIEEFVNAFDYGDPLPTLSEKVSCRMEQAIHPFLQQRNVLRVAMRTAATGRASSTPLRLTLLLDNSGSMERADRQATVRRAFALLASQLQPNDQVTLISFARQPRLLADQVRGDQAKQLVDLVDSLPSEGGTNIEAALQLAYEKASEQRVENGQNRIVLLTDGAVNLGNANPGSLAQMVIGMRDAGIAFDAAGIIADGLNDEVLEALTRQGDGRYYLLDSADSADAGFARQIAGAFRPSAKNVKVQVEFNPRRVGRYKLLGFEKHRLNKEDFRNDQVDAAEMTAAEAGVALYQFEAKPDGEGDVGSISVRFRDLKSGRMVERRWPIPYEPSASRLETAAPSIRIATSAALLAAQLKGDVVGPVDLSTLTQFLSGLPSSTCSAARVEELRQMIQQTKNIMP